MPRCAVGARRSCAGGSRLALAGRSEPPLRVARLRAEGRILEIGPGDLSLTCEEAASLLRDAEVALGEDEVAGLHRRTEGWPAGLYLAALYLREGGPLASAAVSFGGDDRLVSEYMESEFLARISRRQRVFLTRTAVLERMSGPLCEAVLDVRGSAATLTDLAQSNLLLVPLDRRGEWYRYHHLFRDMLLAELQRLEPELIPVLRRRAAGWYVQNGLPEEALEYSIAAGDIDAAAGLVEKLVVPTHRRGRVPTVQRWLRWLEERGGFEGHPMAAVLAALFCALTGGRSRPSGARRVGPGRGAGRPGSRRFVPGRDRGKLRHAPGLRGAGPHGHAPGRCSGGAPAARQRSAAAASADLRPALLRRSGPDRARPRPLRARRPGRGQDTDAGGR